VSLYRSITDALLVFVDKVVTHYERKLQEKETQMADLTRQIKAMQEKVRKLDEVQASAAELLHRYNALVQENAGNEAALKELTDLFDKEIDETVAAITENTDAEDPDDGGEGDDPFTPSGNTPTGTSKSGAASTKKSSSKGKK
jgi:uncharacterized protein YPO0396